MRFYKLLFFFFLMVFSQFSYSADYFYSNDDHSAVDACRNAITTDNKYYCVMSIYSSYINAGNGQYRLGVLQLTNSSGSVVNNYYYGTLSYNTNWASSCNQVPDLGFYSSYSSSPSSHCIGDPSSLFICPASVNWSFDSSTNQCLYGGNDTDGDGVLNDGDNCPDVANSDQSDTDSDGIGDACEAAPDPDADGDGVSDISDNCPNDANSDQANADGDAFGDVCDSTPFPDDDSDGVPNSSDNCPSAPNPSQSDVDGDSIGDSCDTCGPGDYTEHQSFPSDSISSSIPTNYCNSSNCTMTKSSQSCSSGSCTVDYQSTGASCASDSTPSNWQQYFITAPNLSGWDLTADNAGFLLNSGLTQLLGLNTTYKFMITNCVRSSNTALSGWDSNQIGCPNFTLVNVCSTSAEIDAYLQQYIRDNPFTTSPQSISNGSYSVYNVPSNTVLRSGSQTSTYQSTDLYLGADDGNGNYNATVVVTDSTQKTLTSANVYSESPSSYDYYPLRLSLKGCTGSGMGGTGGTGGTGGSGSGLQGLTGSGPALSDADTFSASGTKLMDAIKTTGPLAGVDNLKNLSFVDADGNPNYAGVCPVLSLDTGPDWFGEVHTTVHCDLLESNRVLIGNFAEVFWLLTGLWIFLGA